LLYNQNLLGILSFYTMIIMKDNIGMVLKNNLILNLKILQQLLDWQKLHITSLLMYISFPYSIYHSVS
jgi:hypothetical protein